MAKRKSTRPSLFKDSKTIKSRMKNLGDALVNGTLDAGVEAIRKIQPEDVTLKRKPKYLEITEKRMNNLGVIDLKPYFRRSSYSKRTEDGGWYLVVPIQRKSRDMSRRAYDQLRSIDISPSDQKTVVSDYLYDRRRNSDATMLNYTPKYKTITKKKTGKNRHSYTVFRTVSDESPANSWILNRSKITEDKTSKTMIENVNRLMKWKMKHGWK